MTLDFEEINNELNDDSDPNEYQYYYSPAPPTKLQREDEMTEYSNRGYVSPDDKAYLIEQHQTQFRHTERRLSLSGILVMIGLFCILIGAVGSAMESSVAMFFIGGMVCWVLAAIVGRARKG